MAGSLSTEELGTALFLRTADPTAGVDLVATYGRPCRWITVVDSAGTIVYVGTDGTSVTLPAMPQGHTHLVSAKSITNTSTCTSVIVGF